MKYLKKYTNHQQYEQDTSYLEPNISYCLIQDEVHYMPFIMTIHTNPEVLAICYAQGWCQSPLYMTKAEAAKVNSIGTIFRNNKDITHFEEFLYFTKIKETPTYAFQNCTNLKEIILPPSFTYIRESTFDNCISIERIVLPAGLTLIGWAAFKECHSLKYLNIPWSNNFTRFDSATFYNCYELELGHVIFPTMLKTVGNDMFLNCKKLTGITLHNLITSIGNNGFNGCSGLTEINIPESVTSLGTNFIAYCSNITEINIPSGVTSIGFGFCRNTSIENAITIPSGVKSINEYTFFATKIPSVVIPSGVTTIKYGAFNYCYQLTSVTILAETPPTLGNICFSINHSDRVFYVPASSVEAYKTASGWSTYANRIQAIPE